MDKKILTAEEILEKAKELGYDVSLEDCEEAAEFVNTEPMTEDGEFVNLDEDDLEAVVGGAKITKTAIKNWLNKQWAKRPGKSAGKISAWETAVISAATAQFGFLGCTVATAFFLLY